MKRRRPICSLIVSFFVLSSLNAQQALTIDSLIASRNLWPREVTINVAHQIPLVVNGKLSGSAQVPAGRVYPVKSVASGGVVVDALGSALTFQATDTDVLARAELAKTRLEALAASRASMTPAAKSSPAPTIPSSTPVSATNKIADRLDGKLVACNGRSLDRFEASSLKGKKYLAIYFSASWCGPCKGFTPKLVSWYNEHRSSLDKFDVIFVSRDHTKEDMLDYMKQDDMPWPALNFTKANQQSSLLEKYAGRGIPCLVVVDGEGEVLSHSYHGEQYVGPSKVLQDLEGLARKSVESLFRRKRMNIGAEIAANAIYTRLNSRRKAAAQFQQFLKKLLIRIRVHPAIVQPNPSSKTPATSP